MSDSIEFFKLRLSTIHTLHTREIAMTANQHTVTQRLKPIFVTGSPRSGTTWLGKMLALSPLVNYIHEPFNPDVKKSRAFCNTKFEYPFTYICEENSSNFYQPIKNLFEGKYDLCYAMIHAKSFKGVINTVSEWRKINRFRKNGGVPLVKDPIGLLSCEWLNRHFDIHTIVMTRHPAAFVASMIRLGWGSRPEWWALQQKYLMRDYLEPFEDEIRSFESGDHDVIERASMAWKLHYHVIHQYRQNHKDWIFLRHEDISRDPINTFETLYAGAGIPFTPDIKKTIEEYCDTSNPSKATAQEKPIKLNSKATISNWKTQLTPAEIKFIRERVEDISKHFYTDADWELDTENVM